ncbi:hypothetical protein SNOG_09193 [Parastagonospora nodorum SN15]|uniref:Uncharacterized protein n=1 Tax=Phaeosphaeria nodorum (strain SN15 / ATCC MYA-4574 / FGSC 10173) TaxID=321614 RepID=Q0UGC1_PHANO|nr:hypothetical protein SNOG_09193 [Parastagonospora nodorum SN15]EAT83385.1 hypothetical protein SNOG_09193 [Parastagonospora nodorum SN15]
MFRYARINRKKGKWLKIECREESKSGIINAVPESGQR